MQNVKNEDGAKKTSAYFKRMKIERKEGRRSGEGEGDKDDGMECGRDQ